VPYIVRLPGRYDCTARSKGVVTTQGSLTAIFPVTKYLKDKFNSAGDTQLFEDSIDVVPDGVFFHFELLSDFAVLQAFGNQANYLFFATRQKGHSVHIIELKSFALAQGIHDMPEVLIVGPVLSLMNCPDAF
jgi:hypothetical protein